MTTLPLPLDALAVTARVLAGSRTEADVRAMAEMLRAYALAHNQRLADRAAAMAQREAAAREIEERHHG
jgi:hypothetical protein